MDKFKLNIPKRSLWYLIICGSIIVIFILGGIIPLYKYKSGINNDIVRLRNQIEEQKSLKLTYSSLINMMGKADLPILPNPARTTLLRQDASTFQELFRETAIKSGLTVGSFAPELSTMTGSSNYLLYGALVKGEFVNFRKMLIDLGKAPYLDRIEEIQIQQHPDAMEFRMKMWIALGS